MPRGSQGAARHFASEQTLHQNDGNQDRQNVFKVGLDPLRHFGAAAGRLAATGGGTVIVYQTNTVNTHDSYTPSEVTRKLEDLSDRMKWRL